MIEEKQIRKGAAIFVRTTRDADIIAKRIGCSGRTVRRWMHNPVFQKELDRLGYTGERRFRKAERKQRADERKRKPEYQLVKRLWDELSHIPEYGRAKAISEMSEVSVNYNTIRKWTQDFPRKKRTTPKKKNDAILFAFSLTKQRKFGIIIINYQETRIVSINPKKERKNHESYSSTRLF